MAQTSTAKKIKDWNNAFFWKRVAFRDWFMDCYKELLVILLILVLFAGALFSIILPTAHENKYKTNHIIFTMQDGSIIEGDVGHIVYAEGVAKFTLDDVSYVIPVENISVSSKE